MANVADNRWRRAHPEASALSYRRYHLKKTFGLTLEAFQAMLDGQGGHCAEGVHRVLAYLNG